MKYILTVLILYIILLTPKVEAAQNIFYFDMPTVQKNYLGLNYSYNTRQTEFFFGHRKNIEFNKYFITYSLPLTHKYKMEVSAGTGDVDISSRKSSANDLTAVKLGFEKNIGGDSVVFSQWKVNITLEGGYTTLSNYKQSEIDIAYEYIKGDLALAVAKEFGFTVPFAGLNYYYGKDFFEEKSTSEKSENKINGISPFVGAIIRISDNILIRASANFLDQQGYGGGFNLVF